MRKGVNGRKDEVWERELKNDGKRDDGHERSVSRGVEPHCLGSQTRYHRSCITQRPL